MYFRYKHNFWKRRGRCLWSRFGSWACRRHVCIDGSSEQDLCAVFTTVFGTTEETDVCPGGRNDEDICAPSDPSIKSDDYCVGGKPDSDVCDAGVVNESNKDDCPGGGDDVDECIYPIELDECPGGQPAEDQCYTGEAPDDVCTANNGCAGGDQDSMDTLLDKCPTYSSDGCTATNEDQVE